MGLRTFTFAGTASSTYSMFITEAATYNVPERAVEMLEIPGRNGAYALDLGRFENVEVTYHVVVHKDTNANFQTELSSVRNWLASKIGYQRLTDDYNSDVYRLAVFKGGLETDEVFINGAEFDITFECKPQRFLTSGETEQTVTNNGTLTNPTLFDSSPLLAVKGYGNLSFNGYALNIKNAVMGNVYIADGDTWTSSKTYTFDSTLFTNGDTISINYGMSCIFGFVKSNWFGTNPTFTDTNTSFHTSISSFTSDQTRNNFLTKTQTDTLTLTVGTNSTISNTATATKSVGGETVTFTATQTITYTASAGTIAFSVTLSASTTGSLPVYAESESDTVTAIGYSTKSVLGNPTYIDCDIGECYMVQGGEIITLNNVVALGSDLPKLSSGANTFTFDNTITSLKVTPRYWKV